MTEDENISERISREILNDNNCDKRVLNAAQLSIKKRDENDKNKLYNHA